jgi:hypothetical protein
MMDSWDLLVVGAEGEEENDEDHDILQGEGDGGDHRLAAR